jgi:hypothetical protein
LRSKIGWILDTYIEGDEAILWLHTEDGEVIKLRDEYHPSFYILPKNKEDCEQLFSLLQREPSVLKALWEHKYTNLKSEKKELLHVTLKNTANFKRMIRKLEGHESVKELFNVDLLNIQQYLFLKLNIEPTSKVEVEYIE